MYDAHIAALKIFYRSGRRLLITYDVRSRDGRLRQKVRGHFGQDIPIAFDGFHISTIRPPTPRSV